MAAAPVSPMGNLCGLSHDNGLYPQPCAVTPNAAAARRAYGSRRIKNRIGLPILDTDR